MEIKIKVTYETNGKVDRDIDSAIQEKIASIGGKWYAQGMELRTHVRDICFDLELLTTK